MSAWTGEMRAGVILLLAAAFVGSAAADQPKAGDPQPSPDPPAVAPSAATSSPATAPSPASPPATRRYVVAAMGDSLTDPKSKGGRYLEYLHQLCPQSRFDSYGKGGNMVNQMRGRFLRDIFGEPPAGSSDALEARPPYTHVLVLGGINDICSDESAARSNGKIEADLGAMYQMARDHGALVVAVTLPPWGGFKKYYTAKRGRSTREINQWIKDQRDLGKVDALVDIFPIMSCGVPSELCEAYGFKDRVHWNLKGHEIAGEALRRQIFADCE